VPKRREASVERGSFVADEGKPRRNIMGEPSEYERALPSSGSEMADWMEVWCNRCRLDHEMHTDQGGGCEIMVRAAVGEPVPEIVKAGYVIGVENGADHEIPNVCNSLPAAAFCTKFEPCGVECRQHPNGAVISGMTLTVEGWKS
jgi:hypothetical protein